MPRFEVTPEQLAAVGAAVAEVAPQLEPLTGMRSLGGAVAEPPATAAALEGLATQWASGADRLADDIYNLGTITQASAYLYQQTDETVIGPPP
jgi:hypothetical protein